jgi:hypothetical protein
VNFRQNRRRKGDIKKPPVEVVPWRIEKGRLNRTAEKTAGLAMLFGWAEMVATALRIVGATHDMKAGPRDTTFSLFRIDQNSFAMSQST